MKRKIGYIFLFLMVGCLGFDVKEPIVGNYYLVATDEEAQMSLSYCDPGEPGCAGIIQATVFAVGFNDHYIIAKQHPRAFPGPPDKSITNYYILSIDSEFNWRTQQTLFGPLSLKDFLAKRKSMGIPDALRFTIIKERLE